LPNNAHGSHHHQIRKKKFLPIAIDINQKKDQEEANKSELKGLIESCNNSLVIGGT